MSEQEHFRIKNKILIEPDLFYSPAFNDLSKSGIVTLLRCLQKRRWEKTKVHGRKITVYANEGFIFPYREASFLNIGTTQHWKNIKSLIEIGFLDLIYQGGSFQKHDKEKDYNVYSLSERWRFYGKPEFITIEKPKILRNQFHIRENIKRHKLKSTSLQRRRPLHKREDERTKQDIDRLHKHEDEGHITKSEQTVASAT